MCIDPVGASYALCDFHIYICKAPCSETDLLLNNTAVKARLLDPTAIRLNYKLILVSLHAFRLISE